MSKLSDLINTTITNKRIVSNISDFSITYENPERFNDIPNKYDYLVNFRAVLGKQAYISENLTYNKEYLNLILKDIKRAVIEEIFGEFREPIRNIKISLYERKYDEAMDKLRLLEESMFNV